MTRLTGLIIFLAVAPDLFGGNAEPLQQVEHHADCSEVCEQHDDCSKSGDVVNDC